MRGLKSVLLGLATFLATTSVLGASSDPGIAPTVMAVPTSVTLSRLASKANLPLTTYAAYQLDIKNNTTNTLNRIFLDGVATNPNGTTAVNYDSFIITQQSTVAGTGCSAGSAANKVHCDLGSLNPGDSLRVFVVFQAPTDGSSIQFDWSSGGYEGNSLTGQGCCATPGTAYTSLIDPTSTATSASFLSNAQTFLKPTGGTVFTGNEAITTSTDGWSTIVTVPSFNNIPWANATIAEAQSDSSCQSYVVGNGCFSSSLGIKNDVNLLELDPSGNTFLTIIIRWDKSYFNLGSTKPADVKLYYQHLDTDLPVQVNLCSVDLANNPTTTAPSAGKPCMPESPKILKSQDTPVKDLWGDLQFTVRALNNGKYAN